MNYSYQQYCRAAGLAYIAITILATAIFQMWSILIFVYATLFASVIFLSSFWKLEIRTLFVWITAVCIVFSVFQTHWPLRLRFAVSKPVLQRAVDRAHQGDSIKPGWYGLFRPVEIRIYGSNDDSPVAFDGSPIRGSFGGIVFAPHGPPGNLNYDRPVQLNDDWYFVNGD